MLGAVLENLYGFNPTSRTWTLLPVLHGSSPQGRGSCAMTSLDGLVYLFGGYTSINEGATSCFDQSRLVELTCALQLRMRRHTSANYIATCLGQAPGLISLANLLSSALVRERITPSHRARKVSISSAAPATKVRADLIESS